MHIGRTGAFVLPAITAIPDFALPILPSLERVPSGNITKALFFSRSAIAWSMALPSPAPLTTGNAPHFVISHAKNLFFSNSSIFAINEKCALFTAAISGGSP